MADYLTDDEAARLEDLESKATPGEWKFYRPSEFPRDWRVSRDCPAGDLGPGTRDYIGRFTASHDPAQSGNGGRALEGPLRCDIEVMVAARNALPKLLAERRALRAEVDRLKAEIERCALDIENSAGVNSLPYAEMVLAILEPTP